MCRQAGAWRRAKDQQKKLNRVPAPGAEGAAPGATGKSKKTHDSGSRSENVPHKKRANRESSRHGEGGSSVQEQQQQSSPSQQLTGEQIAQQERRQHL
ncbi:hypothetical protein A2U01_0016471, partial [Trifolium medium]|nr:hypothetical protein [Trifolium medium]